MKIGYYNCEIAEYVTEKWEKKSEILPVQIAGNALLMSGQGKRYDLQIAAREVAQMEGNSFADAWTETMIADSLAQSYNHLWIVENEAGVTCGYLLADVDRCVSCICKDRCCTWFSGSTAWEWRSKASI